MEILRSPLYNHISSLIACNSIELSSSQMIKRTNGGGSNILLFSKQRTPAAHLQRRATIIGPQKNKEVKRKGCSTLGTLARRSHIRRTLGCPPESEFGCWGMQFSLCRMLLRKRSLLAWRTLTNFPGNGALGCWLGLDPARSSTAKWRVWVLGSLLRVFPNPQASGEIAMGPFFILQQDQCPWLMDGCSEGLFVLH